MSQERLRWPMQATRWYPLAFYRLALVSLGLMLCHGDGLSAERSPGNASAAAQAPTRLVATCWGAAGRVSGSLHVLDTGNGRWMIDCGTFFPDGEEDAAQHEAERLSASLPPGATEVSALLLTHAHADHSGRIPLLVNSGFDGPIFATQPTLLLLEPMLGNAVRFDRRQTRTWRWSERSRARARTSGRKMAVHWQDCRYAQSIAPQNLATATGSADELEETLRRTEPPVSPTLCRACVSTEVEAILGQVRSVPYQEAIRLAPGVRAGLLDAGHIPGSASVVVEVDLDGKRRRVLFSGDLGSDLSAVTAGPRPAPNVDAVFVEATYGTTRRGPDVASQREQFRRRVGEAVARGDVVWIPCFALDRTQRILYELRVAQQEGVLPESIPIYCPSPTAKEITAIYRDNLRAGWFRDEVAANAHAFSPGEIVTTVPSPSKLPRPCIIISTSDITYTEWMRTMLRALLPDASTTMMLVGYADAHSAAGQLKAGARELVIGGQPTPVAADIHSFGCFSGHGDAADIDRWLGNIDPAAPILLVHGGPEELQARAAELRERGRKNVHIPEQGIPIDLMELIRAGREM